MDFEKETIMYLKSLETSKRNEELVNLFSLVKNDVFCHCQLTRIVKEVLYF